MGSKFNASCGGGASKRGLLLVVVWGRLKKFSLTAVRQE